MALSLAIKRFTLAVFLTATCNFGWHLYLSVLESIKRERLTRETGWYVCHLGPPVYFFSRFYIEIFLILALIGSRSKGLRNTLPNVIGLSGVVITYIFWWQHIFRLAGSAEMRVETIIRLAAINSFAYLVGGTFLDTAIAASIGLLVLMNVWNAVLSPFRLNLNEERG